MVSQDSNKFNRYKYQWCLNKEIPLQLRIFMPRKEKECRKKWDKITFSKNEGEKYHKSAEAAKTLTLTILFPLPIRKE